MHSVTTWILGLSGPVVYAVVGLLVFAEDALFVGFVLPGETAAVIGGSLAAAHHGVSLPVLMLVVVVAAVLGDTVGYGLGRRFGPRLLRTKAALKHEANIERARAFIREKGPAAVFFGRFVSFFRALVPTLSGASHMRYSRFAAFNLVGGTLWGVGYVLLGFLAGSAYAKVEHVVGAVLGFLIAALVLGALALWFHRRHRHVEDDPDDDDDGDGGGGSE